LRLGEPSISMSSGTEVGATLTCVHGGARLLGYGILVLVKGNQAYTYFLIDFGG
jgi:hypothetical protein